MTAAYLMIAKKLLITSYDEKVSLGYDFLAKMNLPLPKTLNEIAN